MHFIKQKNNRETYSCNSSVRNHNDVTSFYVFYQLPSASAAGTSTEAVAEVHETSPVTSSEQAPELNRPDALVLGSGSGEAMKQQASVVPIPVQRRQLARLKCFYNCHFEINCNKTI